MNISEQSILPLENNNSNNTTNNNNNNNIDFNNYPVSNQVNSIPLNSLKTNLNQSSMAGLSEQGSNPLKSCHVVLKGSEGPASKPIRLTACLLIAAAGSLEAAYTVFGPSLAVKLGIVSSIMCFFSPLFLSDYFQIYLLAIV
ncbi:unnamed protein product [Trichobilharzia regenti]|nr:unnamed protein product [Trichobilharzia regenti]